MTEVSNLVFASREVEAWLREMHDIDHANESAFYARMRNLLNLGLSADVRSGRGRAAQYSAEDFWKMAIALELLQLDVGPSRVVDLVNRSWSTIRADILEIHRALKKWPALHEEYNIPDTVWQIKAESLRTMARKDRGYSRDEDDLIESTKWSLIKASELSGNKTEWRLHFIWATKMMKFYCDFLRQRTGLFGPKFHEFMEQLNLPEPPAS